MANNDNDKERIKLLEEQNRLYKRQLELQEEGYDLSTSYIESLKEVLGIRSKLSTGESNLLNLNKQINKEILNQKIGLDKVSEVQKQIKKNDELLHKARILERNLSRLANEEKVKAAAKQLTEINKIHAQNEYLLSQLSKENHLSDKRLEAINKIIERNKNNLAYRENELKIINDTLSEEDKKLLYTKLQNEQLDKLNKKQEEELKYLKEREKSLGLTGKLTKALSNIPGLGTIFGDPEYMDTINEKIDNIYQKTGKFPGLWKTLSIQIGTAGKMLAKSFIDPLIYLGLMIKGFLSLDEAQTKFQRETGRTVDHLDTINSSLISSSDYIKQATELTKQFGLAADLVFTSETLQEAAELVNLMGLSAEEAGKLALFSKINGKELKNVGENIVKQVSNFNKTNKTAISQKAILQDVAKISNEIAIKFGGNPEKIAAAATEARKLGLTLEGVDKTAESLLNFESSIANELSAELITGQQLNLERARLFALNEDIAGLTKEIGNNEAIINGYVTGNRIQRQAIADAIGMSKEDLAQMVYQQQLQKGLTEEQAAKAAGVTLEDMKRLSIQDSINKSIEKMGEALAGPLEMLAQIMSNATAIKVIFTAIGAIISIQLIRGMAQFIVGLGRAIVQLGIQLELEMAIAAAKMSALSAATIGIGTVIAVGAAIAGIAALTSAISGAKKVGDMYSPADGETQVSTKEGGLFELSKNDSLFAFPESKIKSKSSPQTTSTTSQPQDLSPVVTAINNLANRPVVSTVSVDGKPIAEATGKYSGTFYNNANKMAYQIQ